MIDFKYQGKELSDDDFHASYIEICNGENGKEIVQMVTPRPFVGLMVDDMEVKRLKSYRNSAGKETTLVVIVEDENGVEKRFVGYMTPEGACLLWTREIGDIPCFLEYPVPIPPLHLYNEDRLDTDIYVFVTEDEDDADALTEIGLNATTCVGGFKGFKKRYMKQLARLIVLIVPKNTDESRLAAAELATCMVKFNKNVMVPWLPYDTSERTVKDYINSYKVEELSAKALDELKNSMIESCISNLEWEKTLIEAVRHSYQQGKWELNA